MLRVRRTLIGAVLVAAGLALAPATPAAAQTGPSVTVEPSTGLAEDAPTTVTVTGADFNATEPGVYVAYGPKGPDFSTNAGAYGAVKWVHPNGTSGGNQAPMAPDGSFEITLTLEPVYENDSGDTVDCTQADCYILTFRAHGSPDRSQDTTTPLGFGEEQPPPPPPARQPNILEQLLAAVFALLAGLSL